MPCGKFGATKKPSHTINPIKAPHANVSDPDQITMCASINERIRSPMNDEIMPMIMLLFFLLGSGVIFSNAIHGLAKSAGEYQIAPRNHRISAETRMAQWLK